MANDLTARPVYLDATTAVVVPPTPMRVVEVKLVAGSTASSYTITDGSSGANVLAKGAAPANGPDSDLVFGEPVIWKKFQLTTLAGTGAVVLIFTR